RSLKFFTDFDHGGQSDELKVVQNVELQDRQVILQQSLKFFADLDHGGQGDELEGSLKFFVDLHLSGQGDELEVMQSIELHDRLVFFADLDLGDQGDELKLPKLFADFDHDGQSDELEVVGSGKENESIHELTNFGFVNHIQSSSRTEASKCEQSSRSTPTFEPKTLELSGGMKASGTRMCIWAALPVLARCHRNERDRASGPVYLSVVAPRSS
ncbi:hypothetical protein DVH24_010661, partial [Malus domestica]